MTDYTTELNKPEYASLTNAERLALIKSKTERVVGKIAYGNTLHLVSMLARGLRQRIDTCAIPSLKYAWAEALNPAYLSSPSYSINVSLLEIRTMLDSGLTYGICTQEEHDFIVELASYDKPLFPDVTMIDVVYHFNPELIDGAWHDLGELNTQWLTFKLNTATPEQTYIKIESRDIDGDWRGEWTHNTAHHGVQAARIYKVKIRNEGRQELRWRCEYALDVEVS